MAKCTQNRDPLKLVREGTNQEQRFAAALDPAYAAVDGRTTAHAMVFAKAYAAYLTYYNSENVAEGDWTPFFSEDVSLRLAVAGVQDVAYYQSNVKGYFDFLNNRDNESDETGLKDHLGYLFGCAATLAKQLDEMKEELPEDIPLKHALQNRIRSQLAPAFKNLILYHRDGLNPEPPPDAPYHNDVKPTVDIMAAKWSFQEIIVAKLSQDWIAAEDITQWADYLVYLDTYPKTQIYGSSSDIFERINHIATHHLFTSIFDLFLKTYTYTVNEANRALETTVQNWNRHEPHYALFLAFLKLFEYARTEMNTLTGEHLDFYYRKILRLMEKSAEPSRAHLLVKLAKQATTHRFKAGELFKAGKDALGRAVYFANDQEVVVNRAKVTALKTVYRYNNKEVDAIESLGEDQGRFYASDVANSEDGMGAELTSVDQSWHPFFNKKYQDGVLSEIKMPKAEIGFAVASHYLLMAEGDRTITLTMTINDAAAATLSETSDYADQITCLLTSVEGWMEIVPEKFRRTGENTLELVIPLNGTNPAVTPYDNKTHGYTFKTNFPMLLVKLKHTGSPYIYETFEGTEITELTLTVNVTGLKTLAVSNDLGPIDTSKPFLPFGASPVEASALIIGSKEVFQKELDTASVELEWLIPPDPYTNTVEVNIDYLQAGQWVDSGIDSINVTSTSFDFTDNLEMPVVEEPNLTPNEFYQTASRHGFVRLRLTDDFGQSEYQADLLAYLRNDIGATNPGSPPTGPSISKIQMRYDASQTIRLDTAVADAFKGRKARFFHCAPFGQAEQHPFLNSEKKAYLFPQFSFQREDDGHESEAEFYIGVTELRPPQNLSLLFQIADGTADPMAEKPDPHIHWSYLQNNEWITFAENDVADRTSGLLNSGIISFAIPRDASDNNTLLPDGMYWIRAAVVSQSNAVCRLLKVAAQALAVTFTNRDNDPEFPALVLPPDTICKLDPPNADIKNISQPFATFGGRGSEASKTFYTRISERLRHKDRAIALWDYERLVLEAFPQIFKAKCLPHTQYEPDPDPNSAGIYRELAPGHVTIITIPNQQFHLQRDPLRPNTSLGLLEEIKAFLKQRLSCFITLHVRNPEFEEVWVECNIRLHDGMDETFYQKKLQEDITRFLSPWAFPAGGSPSFGGKIYKSVLVNFVEEQPWVDYVTDFRLKHKYDDSEGEQQISESNEVEGSKAVSILVSVPAQKHKITVIKPAGKEMSGEACPCEA